MRITVVEFATATGRGLRAALGLGCLSVSTARVRALAPAPATSVSGAAPATPAAHVRTAPYAAANGMKDQGTRPPRAPAALH